MPPVFDYHNVPEPDVPHPIPWLLPELRFLSKADAVRYCLENGTFRYSRIIPDKGTWKVVA